LPSDFVCGIRRFLFSNNYCPVIYVIAKGGRMKRLIDLLLFITFIYLLQGCTSIRQTIYLQNMEINGPLKTPPLNITKNKLDENATISLGVSTSNSKELNGKVGSHTKVNSAGYFQVDTLMVNDQPVYKDAGNNNYDFTGNNLQWKQPDFTVFLNADLNLSRLFSISLGLNYSVQDQKSLFGGNLGFGQYNEFETGAIRIDFGVNWQQVNYIVSSVVVTEIKNNNGNSSTVTFFKDIDSKTNINPYITLTYNSNFDGSPINFFISGGYFSQSIINYSPSNPSTNYYPFGITHTIVDARGEATAGFIILTPGIYYSFSENSRINIGVRFLKETQVKSLDKTLFILPFLQYDISL